MTRQSNKHRMEISLVADDLIRWDTGSLTARVRVDVVVPPNGLCVRIDDPCLEPLARKYIPNPSTTADSAMCTHGIILLSKPDACPIFIGDIQIGFVCSSEDSLSIWKEIHNIQRKLAEMEEMCSYGNLHTLFTALKPLTHWMPPCRRCKGLREIDCLRCASLGSPNSPSCFYCEGKGKVSCYGCRGKGQVR